MDKIYQTLLNDERLVVFVKDENANILFANDMFKGLDVLHANMCLQHDDGAFDTQKKRADYIREFTNNIGRNNVLHIRKAQVEYDAGQRLELGVGVDMSEHIMRERALRHSNVMLESYAAVAAHDLRSPLAAVQVCIEAIRGDEDSEFSPRVLKYLDMMDRSVRGLVEQIASVLSLFQARQVGRMKAVECDLAAMIEEVKFNLSNLLSLKKGRIEAKALPKIQAHKTLFQQLLHNLIENSLKFHKPDIAPVIYFRYRADAGVHYFELEDNGRGLPEGMADRLFDFGVHQMRDDDEGEGGNGYGIGLALCRDVVALHGGRIWVDGAYKDGCRICFEVPHIQA